MSTARGALSVVGQAVGAYFGGPIGAAAGGIIGGEIGGLIDGPPEGPRLDDLSAPQIQYGGKIPRLYGGPRWFEIAPLWMTEKREDSETVGGKGGDSGVEQFSYRIDMLVRVCESREGTPCEVIAVTGVEVDGQLVWSELADGGVSIIQEQEIWADMAVQLGHEDQAPWSVMEAAEGAANANAYRGYLTVGFQDFLLGPGGTPRRVRIQAITNGTQGDGGDPVIYEYTGADQSYVVGDETAITVYAWGAKGATATTGGTIGGGGGYIQAVVPVTPGETITVVVGGGGTQDGSTVYGGGAGGGQSGPSRFGGGGGGRSAVSRGGVDLCTAGGGGGSGISGNGGGGGGGDGGGNEGGLGGSSSSPGLGGDSGGGIDGSSGAGYLGGTGAFFNVGDPPDSVAGGGGGGWFGGGGGGAVGEGTGGGGGGGGSHADYLIEAIGATDNDHANPSSPYYPGSQTSGRLVIVPGNGGWTAEPVDLRDILEYEAQRCAPLTAANIDFSSAEGIPVDCHVAIGSAAEAMQPLLTRFWFDLFSSDKLYLVRRGGEVEQTVSYKWSGSGAGGRSESFAGLKRSNDMEIGRKKAVTYSNILSDGESDTRTGDRESISSDVDTLSMNLNMIPSEAQGLADTATADARVAGHTATIRLGARHGLLLQPGSVLDLIDHHGNTYRTLARRVVWDRWVWDIEVRLDDPAVLQAAGIAVDLDQRAITVAPLPEATLYVLDIPLLRQQDDGPGEYIAVTQTGRFRGVDIFKSSDDVTYVSIAEADNRATAGVCDSELPAFDGWGWDNSSVLTVTLDDGSGGTLSSATKAAIEASRSLNLVAVGAHGRWELLQFATATLITGTTYELTGLLRNLLGTEWTNADHQLGDDFVVINAALVNVPGSVSDLGQTRYYKAVPSGRSLSSATAISIECEEQRLLPYAPTDVWNDAGTIRWNRRSRMEGAIGLDPPIGEVNERYDAELYDGVTLEDGDSGLTAPEWTPIDPSGLTVRVYQISDLVGRGHVAEKEMT